MKLHRIALIPLAALALAACATAAPAPDVVPSQAGWEAGQAAYLAWNDGRRGWTEGVALMREGETYQFVIPAALAYGDRWVGGEIPPNSVLLFEVELLDVL